MRSFRFSPALPRTPALTAGDGLIILGLATVLYLGARLAVHAPAVVAGPDISLSPRALPWYALLSRAWLVEQFGRRAWAPLAEAVDRRLRERLGPDTALATARHGRGRPAWTTGLIAAVFGLTIAYGGYQAIVMLLGLPITAWEQVGAGLVATLARVAAALLIALLWTIPVGVAIGTNRRLAAVLQPVVQVVASVPATALFPVLLLALLSVPGGLNLAAVLLMLLGTQWYLLFNIIAGAAAIPQDLRYTTDLLRLSRAERWRTLNLPALFPYIVTGAITASGGAWNASIVAEYVQFAGQTHSTVGVGSLIAQATAAGDYPLLLAATLALIVTVVLINRTFWLRLYRLAEQRFRME